MHRHTLQDLDVIAGQDTVGMEIVKQLNHAGAVLALLAVALAILVDAQGEVQP